MTTKYTKKDFMENITSLTSPFEQKQNGQGKSVPTNLAEKIQEVARKNKGIRL